MVIYMDQYRTTTVPTSDAARYVADGAIDSGANPIMAMVYMLNDVAQRMISPELPPDSSPVDVDTFLGKVYALAAQI